MSEEQELLSQQPGAELDAESTPEENMQPERSFEMQIGGTNYIVGFYHSRTSHETLEDKVKKLIERDMLEETFEAEKKT
ncbi:MAG: transposon-encoded TnpW family protein [Clostridiales bacterium]|nr:transposon-encoded TnpW family protein [Clostridiales bacterium]